MITISRVADLGRMTRVENLSGVTFTGEEDGHKFVVSAMLDNAIVPLTGHVSGKFIRPNGATVALTESEDYAGIEEGKAWVILAGNCYREAGPFGLSITHVEGSKRTVIYACAGYIRPGETSSVIDPENVINIDAIAAMMGQMEDATEDAEAAAAFVPNVIAPAYSTGATYAVGDYCTKDGYLYRCNTAISTAEAWTAAHWTQVTTGAELGDLKSAISVLYDIQSGADLWTQGTPVSVNATQRVTTVSSVNDLYSIVPTGGFYFTLYAIGQGYLRNDGTFVSSISSAKIMQTEFEIQPLISPFSANAYTWKAVAGRNDGTALTPSDAAGFVLKKSKLDAIESVIANVQLASTVETLAYLGI